jgi:hypothetical protein
MKALRLLLCHKEQFGDPTNAIARTLVIDRDRSAAAPLGWGRVPALEVLRDMEYIGPYDLDYDLDHVQSVARELSSIYVTIRHPDGWEKLPVFAAVRADVADDTSEPPAQLLFIFTERFLELAKATLSA